MKFMWDFKFVLIRKTAQSVGVVEYTDRISAEGEDSHNECPVYNIK